MQKLVPNGVSVGVQRLELPGIPRCKRGIDVDSQAKRSMTDFPNSLCYPPWIPASAVTTDQVQQDAAGVWGVTKSFSLPPRLGARGLKPGSWGSGISMSWSHH